MKRNNDYLEILLKQCDEIKEILNSGKKASCASVCYGEICQMLTKDFLPPVEREDIASISYALLETCRRCSEYVSTNNKTNENILYQINQLHCLTKCVLEKKKTCEDEIRRFVSVNFKCGNEFERIDNKTGVMLNNSLRDYILAIQTAFFKNL